MKYFLGLTLLLTAHVLIAQQLPTAGFVVSDNALCVGECIDITNTSSDNGLSW